MKEEGGSVEGSRLGERGQERGTEEESGVESRVGPDWEETMFVYLILGSMATHVCSP
jgi:hypothetical protein